MTGHTAQPGGRDAVMRVLRELGDAMVDLGVDRVDAADLDFIAASVRAIPGDAAAVPLPPTETK